MLKLTDFIQKERLLVTAIEKKVDSLLKSGLDHPCKDSCSGWGQGYDRHQYDSLKKRAQLLEIVEILSEALIGGFAGHCPCCDTKYSKKIEALVKINKILGEADE